MQNKLNKHDRYVSKLVQRLEPIYDDITTNMVVIRKKRTVAEIDVLAVKDGKIHLFEVKCSHRIVKAKRQLTKLKKYFQGQEVSLFFYCGIGDLVVEVA